MMRSALLTPSGIAFESRETPRPQASEVLMRVRASSLNRADLFMVEGRAHGAHGGVGSPLGLEWSGEVVEVGADVPGIRVGDRLMASGIGGFADYAVTDWRRTFPFPAREIGYAAAACLPVSLRTTFTAIVATGQLARGQSVMVLGASSAVGLMSLQVARELGAGLVIGTSTKAQRRERLAEFGADLAIDSQHDDWVQQVLAHTDGRGVDLLIDFLAGPYVNDAMRAVALGGRIVNVGRMAGEAGHFDFDLHSLRRIQYLGTTFRTRSNAQLGEIAAQVRRDLWPALEAGRLDVPIDVRLPLDQLPQAFDLMRTNAHFGKIVLDH